MPGKDFKAFMEDARRDPEIAAYLDSFAVMIGNVVLTRRVDLGWTQQNLARQAGTTQARISQIEAGFEDVKMETLNKVFMALGLTRLVPHYREDAATYSA